MFESATLFINEKELGPIYKNFTYVYKNNVMIVAQSFLKTVIEQNKAKKNQIILTMGTTGTDN